ncbi:MAG TPA: hypothetical protein VKW78_14525 [Terriglobales bacterium]|nr:hypothetical protein [Terriglobales bacterium]
MKNIHEVLRDKEQQIEQLQRDIEVLRAAARLLDGEGGSASSSAASREPVGVSTATGGRRFP